ncbi:gas vesicle protein GvpG [Streptomyces sp. NPDC057302]|uniref:gas vesicle protein GvpG n=1 Tax=Streptomyces sp. NPDC057302 TaxID=3346094 RepID=UPI00362C187D
MGLITGLLTLPLAPVRGTMWVLEQVTETAEREYYDPAPVQDALVKLEQDLIAGKISEDEFDQQEDELLDRLEILQAHLARLDARQ